MFLESLAIDRRRLGNDHPEVAIKLVNLSRLNNDLHNCVCQRNLAPL